MTALLPIAHGLGMPAGQTAALVTALYLATAIAQPTAGKAAVLDRTLPAKTGS